MSKVVLYSAISVDGFIAGLDGDSEWVDDAETFEKAIKEYGCIVLGRTTFEQYEGELYPIEGVQHIVLTARPVTSTKYRNVQYAKSVDEAIKFGDQLGFSTLLLVGGSKTNEGFAGAHKIDELILDVHPLILGKGKRLLGSFSDTLELKLVGSETSNPSFVQLHYKVIK